MKIITEDGTIVTLDENEINKLKKKDEVFDSKWFMDSLNNTIKKFNLDNYEQFTLQNLLVVKDSIREDLTQSMPEKDLSQSTQKIDANPQALAESLKKPVSFIRYTGMIFDLLISYYFPDYQNKIIEQLFACKYLTEDLQGNLFLKYKDKISGPLILIFPSKIPKEFIKVIAKKLKTDGCNCRVSKRHENRIVINDSIEALKEWLSKQKEKKAKHNSVTFYSAEDKNESSKKSKLVVGEVSKEKIDLTQSLPFETAATKAPFSLFQSSRNLSANCKQQRKSLDNSKIQMGEIFHPIESDDSLKEKLEPLFRDKFAIAKIHTVNCEGTKSAIIHFHASDDEKVKVFYEKLKDTNLKFHLATGKSRISEGKSLFIESVADFKRWLEMQKVISNDNNAQNNNQAKLG